MNILKLKLRWEKFYLNIRKHSLKEKEKLNEAERLLTAEKLKVEVSLKEMKELEKQLYTTSLENEACCEKFEQMIKNRDMKIKQLQVLFIFFKSLTLNLFLFYLNRHMNF